VTESLSVEPRYKSSVLTAARAGNDAGAALGGAKQILTVRRGHGLCDVRVSHRDHLQGLRVRRWSRSHEWHY